MAPRVLRGMSIRKDTKGAGKTESSRMRVPLYLKSVGKAVRTILRDLLRATCHTDIWGCRLGQIGMMRQEELGGYAGYTIYTPSPRLELTSMRPW